MSDAARPLYLSGGLSVLAAALAIMLVADRWAQQNAVLFMVVAAVVGALAVESVHRDERIAGGILGVVAAAGAAGALYWGVTNTYRITITMELVPGLLGIAVLALGLAGALPGRERTLVTVGTGLVLLGTFVSGIVNGAGTWALLASMAATVLAWDLGEQAVNLGEQVGRAATTWEAELTHGAGTLGVGVVGAGLAKFVYDFNVTDVPLAGLAVLLGAAVALAAALYN